MWMRQWYSKFRRSIAENNRKMVCFVGELGGRREKKVVGFSNGDQQKRLGSAQN